MGKTSAEMFDQVRTALEDEAVRVHAHERIAALRALETRLLEERIFRGNLDDPPTKTELAIEVGVHPSQASRLERRLLARVLGIIQARERKSNGGAS